MGKTQDPISQPNIEEDDNAEDDDDSVYRDTPVVEPENLCDTLYDSFLLAVLKLIKTFNLKLKNVAEDEESDRQNVFSSVSNTLQPVNQKDFILFQNLVDFWCLVLTELDNRRLSGWVYVIGTTVIDQSVMNPLVSGFYKMVSQIMIVCEEIQFFDGCKQYHFQINHQRNEGELAKVSTFYIKKITSTYKNQYSPRNMPLSLFSANI